MSDENQKIPLLSEFADERDMVEIIELFVGELPERVRTLTRCLEEQRMEDLAMLAHQLKGAGGGYGFPTLGVAAAYLESELKKGVADPDTIRHLLDKLVDLCNRASMNC